MNNKELIMLLTGPIEELMVMLYPLFYRKYFIYDRNGVPLFFVNINKDKYGLLKRALLFNKKMRSEIESIGKWSLLGNTTHSQRGINIVGVDAAAVKSDDADFHIDIWN